MAMDVKKDVALDVIITPKLQAVNMTDIPPQRCTLDEESDLCTFTVSQSEIPSSTEKTCLVLVSMRNSIQNVTVHMTPVEWNIINLSIVSVGGVTSLIAAIICIVGSLSSFFFHRMYLTQITIH